MTSEPAKWHFPRRALLDGHRPPVQVISYDGNGFFSVVRSNGRKRAEDVVFVKRERLTFIKDKEQ